MEDIYNNHIELRLGNTIYLLPISFEGQLNEKNISLNIDEINNNNLLSDLTQYDEGAHPLIFNGYQVGIATILNHEDSCNQDPLREYDTKFNITSCWDK